MNRIMLDLETLGRTPGCAIVSIGAVRFGGGGITDTFYRVINQHSCAQFGLTHDPDTVAWWMQQEEAARNVFYGSGIRYRLTQTLLDFNEFIEKGGIPVEVWGNGAGFDNVILAEAYNRTTLDRSWTFRDDRCYRTIIRHFPEQPFVQVGVAHNALDDAVSQALHLMKIAGY